MEYKEKTNSYTRKDFILFVLFVEKENQNQVKVDFNKHRNMVIVCAALFSTNQNLPYSNKRTLHLPTVFLVDFRIDFNNFYEKKETFVHIKCLCPWCFSRIPVNMRHCGIFWTEWRRIGSFGECENS